MSALEKNRLQEKPLQEDGSVNNRKLIAGFSVASGVVGLIPLPLVGDLGIGGLRVYMIRRIARRWGVNLTIETAMAISGESTWSLSRFVTATAAILGLKFAWRQISRALLMLFRFDDMARTFLLGTYFDHYCRSHHKDGEIDLDLARVIHQSINAAVSTVHLHLISALFQKIVSDVVRAGTFVPRTLWSLCQSALKSKGQDQIEQVVEDDVQGFFGRVTGLLEKELASTGRVTRDALQLAFDEAWQQRAPHDQHLPMEQLLEKTQSSRDKEGDHRDGGIGS